MSTNPCDHEWSVPASVDTGGGRSCAKCGVWATQHDVVKDGISYGGHYTPPMHSEEIKEAHNRLDGYGIVRESGDDEMPPNVLLTAAERIDRLERGSMMAYQRALDEVKKYREQRDEVIRLAKEATNGWACYAKRRVEHDEIARLHSAIAEAARRP